LYASTLIGVGRFEDALPELELLLEVREDDILRTELGICLTRLERFEEAREHFSKVLEREDHTKAAFYKEIHHIFAMYGCPTISLTSAPECSIIWRNMKMQTLTTKRRTSAVHLEAI
jgi:tetratricopeptide (TPR) repeat protein